MTLLCLQSRVNAARFHRAAAGIFGELDTPEGVKANVRAIRQIMDQAGRRDSTVKVYANGSHNLMEVPPENPNEHVRLKRFPPAFFESMVAGPQHSFVSVDQQGVRLRFGILPVALH